MVLISTRSFEEWAKSWANGMIAATGSVGTPSRGRMSEIVQKVKGGMVYHTDTNGNQRNFENPGYGKSMSAVLGPNRNPVGSDVHPDAAPFPESLRHNLSVRPDPLFTLDYFENGIQLSTPREDIFSCAAPLNRALSPNDALHPFHLPRLLPRKADHPSCDGCAQNRVLFYRTLMAGGPASGLHSA